MVFVRSYHLALLSPISIHIFMRLPTERRYTVGLCVGLNNDQITVISCGST